MDIGPIKTENNYKLALEEVEGLMDAERGTPKGDRLEALSTLIAAWEEKHHTLSYSLNSSSSGS